VNSGRTFDTDAPKEKKKREGRVCEGLSIRKRVRSHRDNANTAVGGPLRTQMQSCVSARVAPAGARLGNAGWTKKLGKKGGVV